MLRRAWSLFAYGWFIVFVLNGMTKQGGIGCGDLLLASAPWYLGLACVIALRYVATGSFLPPRPTTMPPPKVLRPYRVK